MAITQPKNAVRCYCQTRASNHGRRNLFRRIRRTPRRPHLTTRQWNFKAVYRRTNASQARVLCRVEYIAGLMCVALDVHMCRFERCSLKAISPELKRAFNWKNTRIVARFNEPAASFSTADFDNTHSRTHYTLTYAPTDTLTHTFTLLHTLGSS